MKFAVAVGRINKQWNEAELNVSQKNFCYGCNHCQSVQFCSFYLTIHLKLLSPRSKGKRALLTPRRKRILDEVLNNSIELHFNKVIPVSHQITAA